MSGLLIFAYSLVPFVNFYAYCPQIYKLWKSSPEESRSNSLNTWTLWLGCSLVSTLYSGLIVQDFLLTVTAAINFGSCSIITSLIAWKKSQDSEAQIQIQEKPHQTDTALASYSAAEAA